MAQVVLFDDVAQVFELSRNDRCITSGTDLIHGRFVGAAFVQGDLLGNRGSKPEPQKIPSFQLQPDHERVQVDHLAAALERVVPVQQDVPPGCR